MNFFRFLRGCAKIIIRGDKTYYIWLTFLILLMLWGVTGYFGQLSNGLIKTNMRDSVSWAFYIGNFTFLVGVAAAAVMLVIPAYIYDWKPIKEIVSASEGTIDSPLKDVPFSTDSQISRGGHLSHKMKKILGRK